MNTEIQDNLAPLTIIGRVEHPPVMIRLLNGEVFTISIGGVHSEKALSIIHRMVECVNACEGIETTHFKKVAE